MKTVFGIFAACAAVALIAFGVYMIDIDQTEEARLPDVDVSVEGGNLPEFDAEVGSVEVKSEEVDVTVPEVEVKSKEVTVDVPSLEVNPPEEDVAQND